MPKPYSNDLRERLVAAVESGLSRHQAAAQFEVSPSTAVNWVKRAWQTGSVEPGQMGDADRVRLRSRPPERCPPARLRPSGAPPNVRSNVSLTTSMHNSPRMHKSPTSMLNSPPVYFDRLAAPGSSHGKVPGEAIVKTVYGECAARSHKMPLAAGRLADRLSARRNRGTCSVEMEALRVTAWPWTLLPVAMATC
jgi:hypothetical protein